MIRNGKICIMFSLVPITLFILVFSGCTTGPDLQIVFSGNINGYLEVCDCPSDKAGGLARRAEYLKSLGGGKYADNILHLDAGGISTFYDDSDRIKAEGIMATYAKMNVRVINVSQWELSKDPAIFTEMAERYMIPAISANIINPDTMKPYFEPFEIIEISKRKVGVIGVCEQNFTDLDDSNGNVYHIEPAGIAIKKYLKELDDNSDFIILLAHYKLHHLKELLAQFPEIDLVLGADGALITFKGRDIDGRFVSYAGNIGKRFAYIKVNFQGHNKPQIEHELVSMTIERPEDKDIREIVDATLNKLDQLEGKRD